MKNLKITVNGVTYDVQVEEVSGSSAPTQAPAPAAAPAPAPAKAPAAPVATGTTGSVEVTAPMPGTILSIKVSVGQQVNKGDTVIVLEAMKMENEIPAPEAGTVASINVQSGSNVETGALLITLN
ncbi:MAG: biotin/lipoyl-containing protein [Eubacteriales bacterium]|nr:biotin/lipoyl-containing protein [Eubacteriales bacterium]